MKDLDENGEDISKSATAPARVVKKKELAEVAKMLEEEEKEKAESSKPKAQSQEPEGKKETVKKVKKAD